MSLALPWDGGADSTAWDASKDRDSMEFHGTTTIFFEDDSMERPFAVAYRVDGAGAKPKAPKARKPKPKADPPKVKADPNTGGVKAPEPKETAAAKGAKLLTEVLADGKVSKAEFRKLVPFLDNLKRADLDKLLPKLSKIQQDDIKAALKDGKITANERKDVLTASHAEQRDLSIGEANADGTIDAAEQRALEIGAPELTAHQEKVAAQAVKAAADGTITAAEKKELLAGVLTERQNKFKAAVADALKDGKIDAGERKELKRLGSKADDKELTTALKGGLTAKEKTELAKPELEAWQTRQIARLEKAIGTDGKITDREKKTLEQVSLTREQWTQRLLTRQAVSDGKLSAADLKELEKGLGKKDQKQLDLLRKATRDGTITAAEQKKLDKAGLKYNSLATRILDAHKHADGNQAVDNPNTADVNEADSRYGKTVAALKAEPKSIEQLKADIKYADGVMSNPAASAETKASYQKLKTELEGKLATRTQGEMDIAYTIGKRLTDRGLLTVRENQLEKAIKKAGAKGKIDNVLVKDLKAKLSDTRKAIKQIDVNLKEEFAALSPSSESALLKASGFKIPAGWEGGAAGGGKTGGEGSAKASAASVEGAAEGGGGDESSDAPAGSGQNPVENAAIAGLNGGTPIKLTDDPNFTNFPTPS